MIKNVEFKTPNNDVLQGTNLARLYDDMSEKIVKESEDFEGRDSGWTLDEILRLEVRTNRYSPFRGSSSFIEVPKQIAETKAIINVINKKDSQCFMWSILAALYPNTSNPNKTSSYVPHLNKLNFDGISFPTPLNERKMYLLLRKGVFSYDYFDSFEKCKDSCLPPISKFYNKLNEEAISVEDYNHACKVFNEFHLNNLGEYCDLYVKTDVLLLTDLFENFRKICMQTYKLDPCWYFTTPALSWDAMLLHTKVAIELFTDYDMLLFIEKGVRGGISQCCNRYAIANNRYMSNFNPDDEIKYLMYLDANNLYGYAMSKYLPLKDFVWSDNDLTEQDILNLSDESVVGYILEVDLEYPSDLHDKHSDFPLAPENKPPPNSVGENNSTRPLNSKIKANAGEKQLNSSVGTKQLNSTGENNSTRQHERNNSTGENNSTQQQERTTQLVSRNETTQLNRRKQLNSSVGTKQLNSALPSTACNRLQPPATAYNHLQPPTTTYNRLQPPTTAYNRLQPRATAYNRLQPPATACNRLHRLYSRIGFFYLLTPGPAVVHRVRRMAHFKYDEAQSPQVGGVFQAQETNQCADVRIFRIHFTSRMRECTVRSRPTDQGVTSDTGIPISEWSDDFLMEFGEVCVENVKEILINYDIIQAGRNRKSIFYSSSGHELAIGVTEESPRTIAGSRCKGSQSSPVDVMWKFGEYSPYSGVILVSRRRFKIAISRAVSKNALKKANKISRD
ncbi:uncharacterized protein TNCV_2333171 [Trichonephila clavipes]|nr:uncharacterized protein TNCV_2333171 [Trichonephila clavipes]